MKAYGYLTEPVSIRHLSDNKPWKIREVGHRVPRQGNSSFCSQLPHLFLSLFFLFICGCFPSQTICDWRQKLLIILSPVFLEWMNKLFNLTQLDVYYVYIIRCVFFQHGLFVCDLSWEKNTSLWVRLSFKYYMYNFEQVA